MINMSHQHEYKDEDTETTITSDLLPVPLNWKVLIKPNQAKTKTEGGLILTAQSKDNEDYLIASGKVAAMGDLAYRDRDTGISWKTNAIPKIGDRVTYGKYAGQKITVNGVKFLLLNDDEITSILQEGTDIMAYVT